MMVKPKCTKKRMLKKLEKYKSKKSFNPEHICPAAARLVIDGDPWRKWSGKGENPCHICTELFLGERHYLGDVGFCALRTNSSITAGLINSVLEKNGVKH